MEIQINVEYLIALVKTHPVIWKKSHEGYKNRDFTREAWDQICTNLIDDFDTYDAQDKNDYSKAVMKKWVNVRDAYLKCLKKESYQKRVGGIVSPKYIYADQLKFLNKNYFHKPKTDDSDGTECSDSEQETEMITEDNEDEKPLAAKAKTPRKELGSKNKKKTEKNDVELRLIQALEAPNDRHISFFKSVLPSLHSFTEDETLQFQLGVLQQITNIKKNRTQSQHFANC